MTNLSKSIKTEMCPICVDESANNLHTFEDGGQWCFACNLNPNKEEQACPILEIGHFRALENRGITKETCEAFGYQVGFLNDEPVHIANFFNTSGFIIGQEIRRPNKKFFKTGNNPSLYGTWRYANSSNAFCVITEGVIDCLSVAQSQGINYPVLSVIGGATNLTKAMVENLDYLLGFKYLVIWMDNDQPGQEAVDKLLKNNPFPAGFLRIVNNTTEYKDANELLIAGKYQEIKSLIWNAQEIKPDYLVTVEDTLPDVLSRPTTGKRYPWKTLTDITHGFRTKEISVIVGAESTGKTEMVTQIMHQLMAEDINIGIFSFEHEPSDTIRRLVGAKLGLKLHIPGTIWNEDEIRQEASKLNNKLYLCNQAGSLSEKALINAIRYWVKAKDVKLIVIDNIKGLMQTGGNELQHIKHMMIVFRTLAHELDVSFLLVSHVSKHTITRSKEMTQKKETEDEINEQIHKEGLEWESGRMPSKENIEGTSAVAALANNVFAISRNIVSQDPYQQRIINVKCLKAKLDGSQIGKTFKLYYNDKGQLEELENNSNNGNILDRVI